jgi:hypothetical protein
MTLCPRPDCAAVRAELEAERARRTLGGVPPACDPHWANTALPAPPSATDPDAPAHRRPRFAASGPYPDGAPHFTDSED